MCFSMDQFLRNILLFWKNIWFDFGASNPTEIGYESTYQKYISAPEFGVLFRQTVNVNNVWELPFAKISRMHTDIYDAYQIIRFRMVYMGRGDLILYTMEKLIHSLYRKTRIYPLRGGEGTTD